MVKRAFCVALGLLSAGLPSFAQQANRSEWPVGAFDPPFALGVYQPGISAGDSFLLFHRGPVRTWADGGWLANQNALSQIGMTSLDLFPVAFLSPEVFGGVSGSRANGVRDSRSEKSATDGKDSAGEVMASPSDRGVYSGGEVGFLYGQWSGKGGGNMWQTYVTGTVGNDKFQITAGASYDEWNGTGRGVRFRSFAAPK
jgi:hypothetical protein